MACLFTAPVLTPVPPSLPPLRCKAGEQSGALQQEIDVAGFPGLYILGFTTLMIHKSMFCINVPPGVLFFFFLWKKKEITHKNERAPPHNQKHTLNSNAHTELSQGQQFNESLGSPPCMYAR